MSLYEDPEFVCDVSFINVYFYFLACVYVWVGYI